MLNEYAARGLIELFKMIDAHDSAAVNSGIVGNDRHRSGYHRSRRWLLDNDKGGDYSIQAAADKAGPEWACCGLDVSFTTPKMILYTDRMIAAARAGDPRLYALREVL